MIHLLTVKLVECTCELRLLGKYILASSNTGDAIQKKWPKLIKTIKEMQGIYLTSPNHSSYYILLYVHM